MPKPSKINTNVWNTDLVNLARSAAKKTSGTGESFRAQGAEIALPSTYTGWENHPGYTKISGTGTPYQNIYEEVSPIKKSPTDVLAPGMESYKRRYIESYDPKLNSSSLFQIPSIDYKPLPTATVPLSNQPNPTLIQNAGETDAQAFERYKKEQPKLLAKAKGGLIKKYADGGSTFDKVMNLGLNEKNAGLVSGIAGVGGGLIGNVVDSTTKDIYGRTNTGSGIGDYSAGIGGGLAKGAATGSALGPLGAAVGGLSGAIIGGVRTAKDRANIAEQKALEDEAKLKQKQAQAQAIWQSQYNKAMQERAAGMKKGGLVQMCAEGGIIKGAGTGKSDSINAKVKPGSFIVPVENAGLAQHISAMMNGGKVGKANLNQKGGEKVKLSNGEHLFDPEEVAELKAAGIDLEKLAPYAENALHFKNGGPTPEKAYEILRDGTIRGKKISEAQRRYFGYIYSQGKK